MMVESTAADIVIVPRKNKNEKEIPESGVLLVNPTEATFEMDRLQKDGAESRFLFNSKLYISSKDTFVAGPAIGAPMAAMTMEKLIALGAKRIILFGWCGAIARDLHVGDVVVPKSALSGEGTSQYYRDEDSIIEVSTDLRESVVEQFTNGGIDVKSGCIWSTDAIYRENRSMLQKLHKEQGVSAVDMEFSALCSVAAFREIEFAAVLVVSDEIWGKSWRPGFSNKAFKVNAARSRQLLIDKI